MERYDAVLDEWTIIDARMKKARSRFAAAVLNGKLYVCGGWDGDRGNLNSVEVYDPITNRCVLLIILITREYLEKIYSNYYKYIIPVQRALGMRFFFPILPSGGGVPRENDED